jgi:Ca-activated chloride channel family protein
VPGGDERRGHDRNEKFTPHTFQERDIMKTITAAVMLMFLAVMAASAAGGMSFPGDAKIALEGRLNCPYVPHNGGRVYLQLSVVTPDRGAKERKPVNLCVVLDRSGSMADQGKIGNAKEALQALIDQLNEGDVFSLVIYDDVVDVLRPACRVESKGELRHLVEGIQPRGWTNLGGGMMEGFRQAGRFAGREYVNRVVLLSDGLANQGITDPRELGRIARRERDRSISLTTMGVGLEYNENLMTSLADQGGGNYYFIESSRNLASILRKEFDMIGCVVAQNGVIELKLSRGVRVIDVVGAGFNGSGSAVTIPIGDLYARERRDLTVELEIPEGTGRHVVVDGQLRFDPVRDVAKRGGSFSADVVYSRDVAEVDRHRDMEAQAKADVAVSTRGVERAMARLDEGKNEEAEKELARANDVLRASPAASVAGAGSVIVNQAKKLSDYRQAVNDAKGDLSKVKKDIQFDNYRVQKQK